MGDRRISLLGCLACAQSKARWTAQPSGNSVRHAREDKDARGMRASGQLVGVSVSTLSHAIGTLWLRADASDMNCRASSRFSMLGRDSALLGNILGALALRSALIGKKIARCGEDCAIRKFACEVLDFQLSHQSHNTRHRTVTQDTGGGKMLWQHLPSNCDVATRDGAGIPPFGMQG
eukprot:679548-Rhodomonas_salina.2